MYERHDRRDGESLQKIPCEACALRQDRCLAELPADKLEEFRAHTAIAIYKRRQVIFHEGTPADGLYILCRGAVKLYQSDNLARDHILDIAGPGDLLGELPLDPMAPYSVSAEALTESQLCYLQRERLIEFLGKNPLTGVRLIAALSDSLSATRRKVLSLALLGAESRLTEVLVHLADAAAADARTEGAIRLAYTRRELAEMIGVSTETTIRLLGRLRKKRVVRTEHRELVIVDLPKLVQLARDGALGAS